MNELEQLLIINEFALLVLADANNHFIKNDVMTKDKFMKIQKACWVKIKKKHKILDEAKR